MAKGIEALLGGDTGGSSDKEDAAQDFIDAVKAGDAAAVATAFSTLYELCAAGEGDEEPESEDEDADEVYGG